MKKLLAALTLAMTMMFFIPVASLAGNLEPSAAPDSTMKTLQEVYDKIETIHRNQVIINNYTTCLESPWPSCACSGRFSDNGDGTVTDCRTNLIWLKNANFYNSMNPWQFSVNEAAALRDGLKGLTDGSSAGDWRLPTKAELQGLGTDPPATWEEGLPPSSVTWKKPGAPFLEIRSWYWTSNEDGIYAWTVDVGSNWPHTSTLEKNSDAHFLAVRSGN